MAKKIRRQGHEEFGEVLTPMPLVNQLLDAFPAEIWNDPMKRWLDPCVGTGNFIAGIVPRLMKSLVWFEPDDDKRYQWIFEQMLFGIDIQPRLIEECIVRFGLQDICHNFVVGDALTFDFNSFGMED